MVSLTQAFSSFRQLLWPKVHTVLNMHVEAPSLDGVCFSLGCLFCVFGLPGFWLAVELRIETPGPTYVKQVL